MTLRSIGYGNRLLLAGLCLLCLLPFHKTLGQESDIEADTEQEIDEITVVGQRSLVQIKRQIERADIVMYDLANEHIDDPMYKVFCRIETYGISNMKRRICKPGYEREMLSDAWEAELRMARDGHGGLTFNGKLFEAELRQHRETRKQMMIELAAENPELAEAIFKRAKLQNDYDEERMRRLQKDD